MMCPKSVYSGLNQPGIFPGGESLLLGKMGGFAVVLRLTPLT